MSTARTRTFKSGNSEAVRLPKDIGFGIGVELDLIRTGDVVTLRPRGVNKLAEVLATLETLPKPKKPVKR